MRCSQPQRQWGTGGFSCSWADSCSGEDLDATSDRSPQVILSFLRSPTASSSSADNQPDRQLDLLFLLQAQPAGRFHSRPSPSFPLSHHTSGSGDPPLGPSESTLTYIPNSVAVDRNCPETSPPGNGHGALAVRAADRRPGQREGRSLPGSQPREAWKWKVKRLEAGGWPRRVVAS